MSALTTFPDVSRLVPLLGSDKVGEIIAAVAAIDRTLRRADRDWHDLATVIRAGAKIMVMTTATAPSAAATARTVTDLDLATYCQRHDWGRLSPSERDFIQDIVRLLAYGQAISPKQQRWLAAIYRMLGGRT